jgi:amino acid transporter
MAGRVPPAYQPARAPIAFLAGIVLLLAGVEVQAVHMVEMHSPGRSYPLATGLGALIAMVILALGAVPIAAILPGDKISLQSGAFDAFGAVITDVWHLGWLTQMLSLLVGLGAISGVFAWLGGPSKALLATADDGELPPVMQTTNRDGMPGHILLGQSVVVSHMPSIYFGGQAVAVVFFLLSAMTVALYLIACMLMYESAIRLRYTRPKLAQHFQSAQRASGYVDRGRYQIPRRAVQLPDRVRAA